MVERVRARRRIVLFNEASLAALKRPTLTETAKKFVKTSVTVKYRGVSLEFDVFDCNEEVELKLAAALKGAASGVELTQLRSEAAFFAASPNHSKVDESLLRSYELARKTAEREVVTLPDPNLRLLLSVMMKHEQTLLEIDATFKVELELTKKISNQLGEEWLQKECEKTMPSEENHVTLQAALCHLDGLREKSLTKMLPESALGSFLSLREMIQSLQQNIEPKEVQRLLVMTPQNWLSQMVNR
eukprot:6481322-Amphidinium_carterae.1